MFSGDPQYSATATFVVNAVIPGTYSGDPAFGPTAAFVANAVEPEDVGGDADGAPGAGAIFETPGVGKTFARRGLAV